MDILIAYTATKPIVFKHQFKLVSVYVNNALICGSAILMQVLSKQM